MKKSFSYEDILIILDNVKKLSKYRDSTSTSISDYGILDFNESVFNKILIRYPYFKYFHYIKNYVSFFGYHKGLSHKGDVYLTITIYSVLDDYYILRVVVNSSVTQTAEITLHEDYKVDQIGGLMSFLGKLFSGVDTNLVLEGRSSVHSSWRDRRKDRSNIMSIYNNIDELERWRYNPVNKYVCYDFSFKDLSKILSRYDFLRTINNFGTNYLRYSSYYYTNDVLITINKIEDDYYVVSLDMNIRDRKKDVLTYTKRYYKLDQIGGLMRGIKK